MPPGWVSFTVAQLIMEEGRMRSAAVGVLAATLAGWAGICTAQTAPPSPLFGQTCTATLPHSIVRHMFLVRNGTPVVRIWAKFPYGKDSFGDPGEAPVTINKDGSLYFVDSKGFRNTIVPDGKGKAEITLAGAGNRSVTAVYDECHPSS
jgi:hypothetical protein